MIIWHKWEDRSRKVGVNAFNFSSSHWNFWSVMSQAVRKPSFSTSIPRRQNPQNYTSELQISGQMDAHPSGRWKTWCQEALCHLSQSTGWYLASWLCLCSAVLRHPPPPCLSTARHRHDQLAKYHPVPWLRWHNVSWHQVFRLPKDTFSWKFEVQIFLTRLQLVGTLRKTCFGNLVLDFVSCHQHSW